MNSVSLIVGFVMPWLICSGNNKAKTNMCIYTFWLGPSLHTYHYDYTENFTSKKWKISDKNSDIFHISIALVKALFSIQKYWYFSYFSTKIPKIEIRIFQYKCGRVHSVYNGLKPTITWIAAILLLQSCCYAMVHIESAICEVAQNMLPSINKYLLVTLLYNHFPQCSVMLA